MSSAVRELPRAPPLLVAAALLLWGWQNGFLLYAVPMALLLESAHRATWRWPVPDREFNLIADLSGVILALVVVYVFVNEGARGIFVILSLLPFVLFLLVLVQMFSERGTVRLSALFISLRRLDPRQAPEALIEVDLSLPYVLLCMICASAGNREPALFFALICALTGSVLWAVRPRRYRPAHWLLLILLACGAGYALQAGLIRMQSAIELHMLQVFDRYAWRYRDPDLATTGIGSVGRIKLSDRIVLRVKTPEPLRETLLLREATYDTYGAGIWSNQEPEFDVIDPEISGTEWILRRTPAANSLVIATQMMREAGVVPVPHGVTRIRGVAAAQVERNRKGAIRMEIREGWIRYTTDYESLPPEDSPPSERDLHVAQNYRDDFETLSSRLGLEGRRPAEIARAVETFFADGFTYTLTQQHRYPRGRYLSEFLFNHRSGHCEFFATATVLLLRAAGVPARYALGFAVDEYSPLERQYVARARHAHSWALAWIDDQWRVIDTTPAIWAQVEQEQASVLEPLFDLWAWLRYRFARWQARDELVEEESGGGLLWLLIPLVILLVWRVASRQRVALQVKPAPAAARRFPGMDSSLYRLVAELESLGHRRRPGETLQCWLHRVRESAVLRLGDEPIDLHYRYRFDPAGISEQEKRRLNEQVELGLQGLGTGDRRLEARDPSRAGT
jgi:transglutaminase-like putative cysteine protease